MRLQPVATDRERIEHVTPGPAPADSVMTYEILLLSFLGAALAVIGVLTLLAGTFAALKEPQKRRNRTSTMFLFGLSSLAAGVLLVTAAS